MHAGSFPTVLILVRNAVHIWRPLLAPVTRLMQGCTDDIYEFFSYVSKVAQTSTVFCFTENYVSQV